MGRVGYAAAGCATRVSDPLHALAGWVMDDNHRGSWPEVSTEAVPAYFSAPAGLYVAAVVEALFGLEMHAPDGYIRVSPNFPDDWPSASMRLKNHRVDFRAIRKPARIRPSYDRETRPENPMVVTCLHERAADRSRRTDSGSPAVRYRRSVRRSRTQPRIIRGLS